MICQKCIYRSIKFRIIECLRNNEVISAGNQGVSGLMVGEICCTIGILNMHLLVNVLCLMFNFNFFC